MIVDVGLAGEDWSTVARRLHRAGFLLLAIVAGAIGLALPEVPLSSQLALLAVGVAVLGIPHGALDHRIAQPLLQGRLGSAWLPAFLLGYLALSLAVVAAWMLVPTVSLLLFLAVSVFHFGSDELEDLEATDGGVRWLSTLVRGSLPIALPSFLSAPEVTPVYNFLLPTNAAWSAEAVRAISGLWLVGLVAVTAMFLLSGHRPLGRPVLLTAGAQVLLFATLPPLIAFALFFCLDHSIHHVLELASRFDSRRGARAVGLFLRAAAPATAVVVTGAAGVALWLRSSGISFEPSLARVVFIGLAALTVPHMLVTALAAREQRREGGRTLT